MNFTTRHRTFVGLPYEFRLSCGMDCSGIVSPVLKLQEVFIFSKISRFVLRPVQSPAQCIKAALSSELNSKVVRLTTYYHEVSRVRMRGVLPPLPHLVSWSELGQIYINLALLLYLLSHA
jgi:hypothetical protein